VSFVKGLLWRLRLGLHGTSLRHLRELRRWSNLNAAQVAQLQRERLTSLLQHAHQHVPYYREQLGSAGVVDDDGVHLERFNRVTPLDKDIIRSQFADLKADDVELESLRLNTSGGSTGQPVGFLQDATMHAWNTAVSMLFDEWAGTRPGDRRVVLWGAQRDLAAGRASIASRAGTWLRNELIFDAYLMTPELMRRYVKQYNEFRPKHILAYAQSLYQWAVFIESEGLSAHAPQSIITSATTLEPHMRLAIERVFKTRVINRYGSREVGGIACEANDDDGLVVSALTHVVEVLGPDGEPAAAGELGELVITLLTNRAMPLIRYRIGDAGILAADATSKPFWPRLQEVAGRVTDIFYTANGDQVYGGYFTRMFYHRDWVAQFQVIQKDYEAIRVRIVPGRSLSAGAFEDEKRELTASIREAMGMSCLVEFEVVDSIAPGPSGKRRYTVSEVQPPSVSRAVGRTES